MPTTPSLSPQAIAALMAGRTIEAIKVVREEQRLGLKEAKDLVDEYVAAHPELRTMMASAPRNVSSTPILWLLVVALLAWLAWRQFA